MTRQPVVLDQQGSSTSKRRQTSRATERAVAVTAIGIAALFVALAVIAVVLPGNAGLGPWLPVHLLLAGAATTAIAGMMPFFSAAISNAPPAPGWLRFGAVVVVAIGALLVVVGRIASPALIGGGARVAGAGGVVFIVGLVLTGAATLLPLRLALGRRRVVFGFVYGMAVVNVACGATLASLLLLGWLPALQDWPALKPAHAWLNVFGFVSLVVAGTLLHLLPTVVGTRIRDSRASVTTYICIAVGPPIAALGFVVGSDVVAMTGAVVLVVGTVALAAYSLDAVRHGAHWTTDAGWHRFTTWSLVAAVGWFVVGSAMAAWLVFSGGATAAGWQLTPLIAPVFVGWVAQVLVGAWSHLVPSVGPGSPARHARQRRILGLIATPRLIVLNAGVLAVLVGQWLNIGALSEVGIVGVLLAGVVAVALLVAALTRRAESGA